MVASAVHEAAWSPVIAEMQALLQAQNLAAKRPAEEKAAAATAAAAASSAAGTGSAGDSGKAADPGISSQAQVTAAEVPDDVEGTQPAGMFITAAVMNNNQPACH